MKRLKPKIVLAVAAHTDDIEFCASGSIATFIKDGAKVYYLILTNGCNGSDNSTLTPEKIRDTRHQEQRDALNLLGGTEVFFMDYPDSSLEITQALKRDIVRIIRKVKPDVVLTMDPTMIYDQKRGFINHPDHRAAGQATLDAIFPMARDRLTFPELLSEGYEPHEVKTVLLVNFTTANFYVDISDVIDLKLEALAKHKSQVSDKESIGRVVREMAEECGQACDCAEAEGFVKIEINNP